MSTWYYNMTEKGGQTNNNVQNHLRMAEFNETELKIPPP